MKKAMSKILCTVLGVIIGAVAVFGVGLYAPSAMEKLYILVTPKSRTTVEYYSEVLDTDISEISELAAVSIKYKGVAIINEKSKSVLEGKLKIPQTSKVYVASYNSVLKIGCKLQDDTGKALYKVKSTGENKVTVILPNCEMLDDSLILKSWTDEYSNDSWFNDLTDEQKRAAVAESQEENEKMFLNDGMIEMANDYVANQIEAFLQKQNAHVQVTVKFE